MKTDVLPATRPAPMAPTDDQTSFAQGYEASKEEMLEFLQHLQEVDSPLFGTYAEGFHDCRSEAINFQQKLQSGPGPQPRERKPKPNIAKMVQAGIEPRRVAELREMFAREQSASQAPKAPQGEPRN